MKLFDKIRILRKARGLSQEQLGYSLSRVNKDGISRQTISDWENGKFEPKLDKIRDLAEVFNVSFDALLDEAVDLDNEQVLQAVLNQQSYKVKEEPKVVEEKKEAPVIKRCNITFKEIVLLIITSYFMIAGAAKIPNYIFEFIEVEGANFIWLIIIELAIDLMFMSLYTVAFVFLLKAIRKRETPKVTLILLLVALGLEFLLMLYSDVSSIAFLVERAKDHKQSPSTHYYVNNYPSTYEKSFAGSIVRLIYSTLLMGGKIAVAVLFIRAYKKPKQVEEQVE